MQKQRYLLIFIILISIPIYYAQNNYGNTHVDQDNLYFEFDQLIKNKQKAKAIKVGRNLFESLISKYPENANLHNLQRRLEVARDLAELIIQGLKSRQKKAFANITNLDTLPTTERHEEEPTLLPPPERLYWANLEAFSHELNTQGLTAAETKFLCEYYDLWMRDWIEKVADVTAQVVIADLEASNLSYYSLVLPLLYMPHNESYWENLDYLFAMMGSDNLDTMSDFCLLRVERPETAIAIAKYKAKSEGRSFSLDDWSLTASSNCVENHRPDLAEKLLRAAIDNISDKNRVVELRLKIADNFSKCGDNAAATKEYRQIAKDFPGSLLYGKVMSSYFACLARQSKPEEILAEIDLALETPQCQRYLPQLLYLKWWALRKTNQHAFANQIGEQLIENYRENPCIAPVLLAHATDALSNQHYDQCQKLLIQLMGNFPQTNSAKQAQKILNRLDKK